ncbi:hypothetical protein [Clostridium baratii]|uniref:hypothetical protein n=1 Tax=Clostridium baratii TaxID=1561 RepID=UPI0030D51489
MGEPLSVRIIRGVISGIITFFIAYMVAKTAYVLIEKSNNNISIEIKDGIIIDSSKENIYGFFGGDIEYETAIKVDDEIIISNDKNVYYEAKDKIGKEIKVEVKNDKNINKKYIEDIK